MSVDARGGPAPRVLRLSPARPTDPVAVGPDWQDRPGDADASDSDYVQGSLAVDFRREAYDSYFGPQATMTADLPEAQAWARRMILATLEACDGSRPAEQLGRWLAPEVHERVARRGQLARRRGGRRHPPPLVRALLVCHPHDGVCEISAVVRAQGRVRALALRMSGVDGRWLVTALELG